MIKSSVAISFVVASVAFIPFPQPPPVDPVPPAVNWFVPPSGPLPWELPNFPDVDLNVETPATEFDEVEHGEGYQDRVDAIQAQWDAVIEPITDAVDAASVWVNGTELPDMTDGDFDTGLDPVGTGSMQASEFSTQLGENIGMVFEYIRLLIYFGTVMPTVSIAIVTTVVCVSWMAFLTFLKLAFQLADMIYSVAVSVVNLVIEILPYLIPGI